VSAVGKVAALALLLSVVIRHLPPAARDEAKRSTITASLPRLEDTVDIRILSAKLDIVNIGLI
jgi:hypothetical protein